MAGEPTLTKEARALDAAILVLSSEQRAFAAQTVTAIVAGASSFARLPAEVGDLAFKLLATIVQKRVAAGVLASIGIGKDREAAMFDEVLAGFSPELADLVRKAAAK